MENSLEKGKSMPIGTITNGFKKVAEGKWRKVSEHGKTKEEHIYESDKYGEKLNRDNSLPEDSKKYYLGESKRHTKEASKLDSKEYSDVDVVGKEKEEEVYSVYLENDKQLVDIKRGDKLVLTDAAKNSEDSSLSIIQRRKGDTFIFNGMAGGSLRVLDSTGDSHILSATRFKRKIEKPIIEDYSKEYSRGDKIVVGKLSMTVTGFTDDGRMKIQNNQGENFTLTKDQTKKYVEADRNRSGKAASRDDKSKVDKSTTNDIEKALVTLEIGYLAGQVSEEQIQKARKSVKNG